MNSKLKHSNALANNKAKCKRYRDLGRREINKIRKAAKHAKKLAKHAAKRAAKAAC